MCFTPVPACHPHSGCRGNSLFLLFSSYFVPVWRYAGSWIPYACPFRGGICWPGVDLVHFLQCCQHPGRVLDEHSTHTTAPRLWGRVSRGTAAHCPALCEALATGARRSSWHVEY